MQDRVPLYPGRVTLTPVDGLTNTYDMVRADEPTQEGTPLNKATFLKDSTASLLGLPNSAVPDDALKILAVGVGYYGFRIKVLLSNGEPAEGVKIEGIMSLSGSDIYTDYNGVAVGKSTESSVTISLISPFLDQKNPEPTVVESTGTITDTTISLLEQTDIIEITESKTAKCSQAITSADITAVGGGGGGGGGSSDANNSSTRSNCGGGGGGGYVTTSLGISTLLLSELIIIIGAGGSAGGTINKLGQPGTDGGTTSVQLLNSNVITALGGNGGKVSGSGGWGGSGNGKGGGWNTSDSTMEAAGNGTGYIFNDSSLRLAGGGGGGGGTGTDAGGTINNGGTPYGGKGAHYSSNNSADSNPGNGFGGGGGGGARTRKASNGAPGGVYLRFHF